MSSSGTASSGVSAGSSGSGSTGGSPPDAGPCPPGTKYFGGLCESQFCDEFCHCEGSQGVISVDAGFTSPEPGQANLACFDTCSCPSDCFGCYWGEPDGGIARGDGGLEGIGACRLMACGLVDWPDGGVQRKRGEETVQCSWYQNCVTGRRPEGLSMPALTGGIAGYLAGAAALESASVPAFRRLASELSGIGASPNLVDRARAAARDEIRHTRVMNWIARAHGAERIEVRMGRPSKRATLELAIENAVEGCVRETFGAALALWQADHAIDPQIRSTMATPATPSQ